jgi:hypothetical protein
MLLPEIGYAGQLGNRNQGIQRFDSLTPQHSSLLHSQLFTQCLMWSWINANRTEGFLCMAHVLLLLSLLLLSHCRKGRVVWSKCFHHPHPPSSYVEIRTSKVMLLRSNYICFHDWD